MGKKINLVGRRFGRLLVLSESDKRIGGNVFWDCICDCGKNHTSSSVSLRRGDTKSCGCLFLDVAAQKGKNKRTHGMTISRAYNTWIGMKQRCLNKNNPKYEFYGGRGISICKDWMDSFEAFHNDMGDPPEGYSLDRINVDSDYEKSNCRWANQTTQQNNRRNNRLVPCDGGLVSLSEFERRTGVSQDLVGQRIRRGVPIEKAVIK